MIILPVQYENHRGPDAVGQHKLTFTIDESVALDGFNPMTIKKGTQFIAMFIEAGTQEEKEFKTETKEETLERFRKHMNSLISSVAEALDVDAAQYRETFKVELKNIGLIHESTKELDLQGYAKAIALLKQKKHDTRN